MEELAERSGMSFRGIAYIEHGRRNPSLLSLLQIASGLGIAPRCLLDFVPNSGREDAGPGSEA